MLNLLLIADSIEQILKIEHGIYILIACLSWLTFHGSNRLFSYALKKFIIYFKDISCAVQCIELIFYDSSLNIIKFMPCKCGILINNIFPHRIHSSKKRNIRQLIVK